MVSLSDVTNAIVDRLKDYMIEKSINISQLAKELKISDKTLYAWMDKSRTPKIDSIWHIADFLGVTVDYLIGREN